MNMRVRLRMFLGVCGLYKGGPFRISSELYEPMFHYLATEEAVTHKQALGFLKLLYQNSIGLTSCPLNNIIDFDR
jgi:hypothetical protein